jgi:hypothetical protein
MAKIVRVNGTVEPLVGEGPNGTLTLEQMQKAVGGYIEVVRSGRHFVPWGICNEEGKCKGLPYNQKASEMWTAACNATLHDYLVGDIIVLDRPNEVE